MQPTVAVVPATVAELEDMTAVLPAAAKVGSFRGLFGGRTDVCPVRWGERPGRPCRLRTGLRQRVGDGYLRQATREVRRVPEPGASPPCRTR